MFLSYILNFVVRYPLLFKYYLPGESDTLNGKKTVFIFCKYMIFISNKQIIL